MHDALYNVFLKHRTDNLISFYFYEDFPYIRVFNENNTLPLVDFMGKMYPKARFISTIISLTEKLVDQKLFRLQKYTSQVKALAPRGYPIGLMLKDFMKKRCTAEGLFACEVVYRIK